MRTHVLGFVVAGLVLVGGGIGCFGVALSSPPPMYTYHATPLDGSASLSEPTLDATAAYNDVLSSLDSLSASDQQTIREALTAENHTVAVSPSQTTLQNLSYVTMDSTVYRLTTTSNDQSSTLSVTPLASETALSAIAVTPRVFSNTRTFGIRATDTPQQVITRTLSTGHYRAYTMVDADNVVVREENTYYQFTVKPANNRAALLGWQLLFLCGIGLVCAGGWCLWQTRD